MSSHLINKKRNIARLALATLIVGGLLTAGWWVYFRPYYRVAITPQAEIAISRRDVVADAPKPSAEEKRQYVVPRDQPRYLTVAKLGVHARVLPVGIDDQGRVAAPAGIWDVGWFDKSAKPGTAGTVFIDGHISGPRLPAVFKDLHTMRPRDEVEIERGDGARFRYRVESVKMQPLAGIDMDALLTTVVGNRPTLVLMTCAGDFDAAAYAYDQRVVVIATLL